MISDHLNKFNSSVNGLRKRGKLLWKFLSFSLADSYFSFAKVICISIERDGIFLVYGTKVPWKTKIESFKKFSRDKDKPVSPEYLASVAAQYVDATKSARAKAVLCIPKSWAIVRAVEFPLAVKENLSDVVSYELDRLTPLVPDNAYWDFKVIAEDAEKISILLAVVRKDEIDAYLEALRARNIKICAVGVSTLAMKSLLKNTYEDANTVFISFTESGYESGVILNDLTVSSLSGEVGPLGAPDIDDIIKETYPLMETLAGSGYPGRMVINATENHYQTFRQKLSNISLSHLDKDVKFDLPKGNQDLSYIALSGVIESMTAEESKINLLAEHGRKRRKTPLFLTAVLAVLIFAVGLFYFVAPVVIGQKTVEEIDREITALKPEMKTVEALKKEEDTLSAEIAAINNFKKQSVSSLNILKEMTSLLPAKTWLTRLRIADPAVEFDGYASSAAEIIAKLENSKYFQKVEFASPTFRDARRNTDRFVVKMELRGENRGSKAEDIRKKNEKKN
jgi:Tfp pilus assembly protein PilN/Tfp pilus assembly PilM family ATPase